MQSKTYLNMLQRGFVRKPVFSRKAETAFQEGARPIHWMEAKQICGTMPIGMAYSAGMVAILSHDSHWQFLRVLRRFGRLSDRMFLSLKRES